MDAHLSFPDWLRLQALRDDDVGALARASGWWPSGRPRLRKLHSYVDGLVAEGRDPGLHEALDRARAEWRRRYWPECYDRAA